MKKVIPEFSRTNKIKKSSGIPAKSGRTEEEVRFWDTHSPLDYPDEFTEVKEPFKFAPDLIKKVAGRRARRGENHDH